jgi:hypothetical protein
MGFPTEEVGYTSTTAVMGDHEFNKGHVVKLEKTKITVLGTFDIYVCVSNLIKSINVSVSVWCLLDSKLLECDSEHSLTAKCS